MKKIIYKIHGRDDWLKAKSAGVFTGAAVDIDDGYIHFSLADQVIETANKYFHGQEGLLLIAIDADQLDSDLLKYEASRGGALFPHLYGPLDTSSSIKEWSLALNPDGSHQFPPLEDRL